jgi:hypothetical protein
MVLWHRTKLRLAFRRTNTFFRSDSIDTQLKVFSSTENITGTFSKENGVLTITTQYWGAQATEGWSEIYSGKVSYTRNDMLPPDVSYLQPQGNLFLALMPDNWEYYMNSCIIGPAYTEWEWRNNLEEEGLNYKWSYFDGESDNTFTSAIQNLTFEAGDSYYFAPMLSATNAKEYTGEFTLGAEYFYGNSNSYAVAGGNAARLGFDSNSDYSVANLDLGFGLLSEGNGSYHFGTGASEIDSTDHETLLVYYEKPVSTLYFEGVNVYLFALKAPANTPLKMNVIKALTDSLGTLYKGETVATSTILVKNALAIKENNQTVGYTLKFEEFEVQGDDGFWTSIDYFEMDEAFFLELTGFNHQGIELAVASEEINPSRDGSLSLFTAPGDTTLYQWEDYRQTMYFNLSNAIYSYIWLSERELYDNRTGGIYYIKVEPYFDSLAMVQTDFPEWLEANVVYEEYSSSYWGAVLEVSLDELAADQPPRYFDLEFSTTGATGSLHINQGGPVKTGINTIENDIKVQRNQQGFMINYPTTYNRLTIYTATGKTVVLHALTENGNIMIDAHTLPQGVCILNFEGIKHNKSIKIVN